MGEIVGAYTTAFRGPLQRHRTRRTPLLLSVSPASCSHVGKAQAAAAAAALTASVSGHRPPGTALLWTKKQTGRGTRNGGTHTRTQPPSRLRYRRVYTRKIQAHRGRKVAGYGEWLRLGSGAEAGEYRSLRGRIRGE